MKRALFAAVAVLTLACDKSDPIGPKVVSRYDLVRLNGLPLPYVNLQTGTSKEEVLSGQIRFLEDGSYIDRTTFRATQGNLSQTYDATLRGPFTREGSAITFTVISEEDPTGDDRYFGTFSNDTLTIEAGSVVVTVWKYVLR